MENIEEVDIKGTLETISNLSLLGMMCIDLKEHRFISTLIEDIYDHSQRLVDDYAVVRDQVTD